MEDERSFGEDDSGEPGLPGLGSAHCFPHLNGEHVERYSRKVFVGGLPPDIDEGEELNYVTVLLFKIRAVIFGPVRFAFSHLFHNYRSTLQLL